jgi:hypothetical protein
MIRNLKVLGMALVAMLAMSALGASMASADVFESEKETTNVTAAQKTANVFTTTAGTVQCSTTTFKGTVTSATKKAQTIKVAPTYSGCTGFGFPATIHTEGCEYNLNITAGSGITTGTVDVECPAGKEITVTAISAGVTKCTVHVPTQTGLKGVTYSSTGAGTTREIVVTIDITSEISYTHTPGSGIGSCSPGGSGKGSYTGTAQATGEDGSGHVGIFMANS